MKSMMKNKKEHRLKRAFPRCEAMGQILRGRIELFESPCEQQHPAMANLIWVHPEFVEPQTQLKTMIQSLINKVHTKMLEVDRLLAHIAEAT